RAAVATTDVLGREDEVGRVGVGRTELPRAVETLDLRANLRVRETDRGRRDRIGAVAGRRKGIRIRHRSPRTRLVGDVVAAAIGVLRLHRVNVARRVLRGRDI